MKDLTFIMIKPDAVAERNVTAILGHFERKGLDVVQLARRKLDRMEAEAFYVEHAGKDFFDRQVAFMTSGEVVGAILRRVGHRPDNLDATVHARVLVGKTDPRQAGPGTIRGTYGRGLPNNAIHASADVDAVAREVALFFEAVG